MSQQHPLIVFLLLIVMGACLALLVVFFASGLVSARLTRAHTLLWWRARTHAFTHTHNVTDARIDTHTYTTRTQMY